MSAVSKRAIAVAIWFVSFTIGLRIGFHLINLSSTIANIIGFMVVLGIFIFSFETKCFTLNKFKKHEK